MKIGRVTQNPAAHRYQAAKCFTTTLHTAGEPESTCWYMLLIDCLAVLTHRTSVQRMPKRCRSCWTKQFAAEHSRLFAVSWLLARLAERLNCCVRAARGGVSYLWAPLMPKKEQSSLTEIQVVSMSWSLAPLPIKSHFSGVD